MDFGPHVRLHAIARPVGLTQWPMPMGFRVNEAGSLRRMRPDHGALPAIGRVAPHLRLLAMQELWHHPAVMHMGRRGRHRMNQRGLVVHADMGLHAAIPRVALLRLMHLGISLPLTILRGTRSGNEGGIDHRPAADLEPMGSRIRPIRAMSCL